MILTLGDLPALILDFSRLGSVGGHLARAALAIQ